MKIVIYVSMFVTKEDQQLLSKFAEKLAIKLKVKYTFPGKTGITLSKQIQINF